MTVLCLDSVSHPMVKKSSQRVRKIMGLLSWISLLSGVSVLHWLLSYVWKHLFHRLCPDLWFFTVTFLNPGKKEIWGWISFWCGGCSVYYRTLNSISGLYLLDVSSKLTSPIMTSKMFYSSGSPQVSFFFSFSCAGDQTKGLALARQVFCHWTTSPSFSSALQAFHLVESGSSILSRTVPLV
jgi:hypothetical protein